MHHSRRKSARSRESKAKPWKESAIREVYTDYLRNCRKRGREFALTQKEVEHLITQECTYCQGPPSNLKTGSGHRMGVEFWYNGIDRKDSEIGYVKGNVVPCCNRCNQIKTNLLSFKEMIAVAKALKKL